jgi:hypothetical protein
MFKRLPGAKPLPPGHNPLVLRNICYMMICRGFIQL